MSILVQRGKRGRQKEGRKKLGMSDSLISREHTYIGTILMLSLLSTMALELKSVNLSFFGGYLKGAWPKLKYTCW